MLQDENTSKSKKIQLKRHITTLESDRLKFMKQLRHHGSQMGENGIRFLGLCVLGGKHFDHINN